MSAPAFAWAIEQGCTLKLPPAERLVLIYLADMANGIRVCWPGQERIVRYTGLALRTVRSAIHSLAIRQLIRVEAAPGIVTRYHILRPDTPANGTGVAHTNPGKMSQGTPANGTGVARQNVPPHPGKWRREPRQNPTVTPANRPPDPSKTQEEDPRARAHTPAREAKIFNLSVGRKAAASPPPPPQAAPPQVEPEEREPTPAEIEANRKRHLADIAAMPPPVAAAIRSLANHFEARFHGPGRWPEHTPEVQVAAVAPPTVRPAHLVGAQLAAMRKQAGIMVPA